MFTGLALVILFIACWTEQRSQRKNDEGNLDDYDLRKAILQARQDLRLLNFTLFGVVVMLGVIADLLYMRH